MSSRSTKTWALAILTLFLAGILSACSEETTGGPACTDCGDGTIQDVEDDSVVDDIGDDASTEDGSGVLDIIERDSTSQDSNDDLHGGTDVVLLGDGVDGSCEPNACGGCAELEGEPDGACGECSDGTWQCDGEDAVACVGAQGPRQWWVDFDGDGFGVGTQISVTACQAPAFFYADQQGDCDDSRAYINPEGIETCNGLNDDCDDETDESPDDQECDDACCSESLQCDSTVGECLTPCAGTRCGDDNEYCCEGADICYADQCITPGDNCEFTENCPVDTLCEPSLGVCLDDSQIPSCEYIPEVGDFDPRLACRWTTAGLAVDPNRNDVVMTPVVLNLSDDNFDGKTDRNDTPDIAFLTYDYEGDGCCNTAATLRIVSGRCNDDATESSPASMVTLASINSPALNNDTGLAAGDLSGNNVPEIVAVQRDGSGHPDGLVAFRRTSDDARNWEVYWQNDTLPAWNQHTRGGATISIADLNEDDAPEVIVGNVVFNGQTGAVIFNGLQLDSDSGVGNNAFLGPASVVADIDNDHLHEVIAGNSVFHWDGDTEDPTVTIQSYSLSGNWASACN
ncbi:MAG: putative metal-binding motif-containing protein, partial [Myxococcales bacterium]|nr:putative metal-binding motif-containing protein [Myxococcales bacterium]